MPWGEYRDVELSEVPAGYLEGLLEKDWFRMKADGGLISFPAGLVDAVRAERDRRRKEGEL